jgi:pyruvate dehydrogenase E1 component alpha subunit
MRERMVSEGIFTVEELDAIDAKALADVEEAVRFAESSPSPRIEEAARDVYLEVSP